MDVREATERSGEDATGSGTLLRGSVPPPVAVAYRLVAALTAVSAGATLGLSQRADERFNPYRWGPAWLADPERAVTFPIRFTFDTVAEIGNFRPLGRIVEHGNYLLTEAVAVAAGLPVYVVLGLIRVASAIVLGLAVVRLVVRISGERHWAPIAVACTFPALLVPAGNLSSMVVFSGMYLQTTTLVVLVVTLFVRLPEAASRPPAARLAGFAAVGASVAIFNELAWIAAPVATIAVATRLTADRVPPRTWALHPLGRRLLATGVGFVAAAVPVRLYIANACARPETTCYVASDPAPGNVTGSLVATRALSGLPRDFWPPLDLARDQLFRPTALLALLVIALVLLHRRSWAARAGGPGPADVSPNGGSTAPIAIGAAFVLAGALLSSLSPVLQDTSDQLLQWREAPVLFVGWALLLGTVVAAVLARIVRPVALVALIAFAALGVASAVVLTGDQHQREANDARLLLADRIAVELASFAPTARDPDADARRCALLAEFASLHESSPSQIDRIVSSTQRAAQVRYDEPFCSEAPG